MDTIARLEELDKARTPGPWESHADVIWLSELRGVLVSNADSSANAQAICAAMNALPALIAIAKAAQEVVDGAPEYSGGLISALAELKCPFSPA